MAIGISAVGIPWYREDDYPEILRIMTDGGNLPRTFKDWLQKAEGVERQIMTSGKMAHRAVIDPKQFIGWCAMRGLNIDAEARTRYASEAAYKSLNKGT